MVSRLLLAVLCVSLGTALAHREGHRSTPLSSLAIGGDILFANNAERPWSVFALSSVVAHNPFGSFEIKLFPNERNASFDLLLKKKQAPGRWFDKPAHPGGDMETRHKRHEEGRKTWARDENVVARTKGGDVLSIQMKDIEAKDHILIVRGSGSFELQACFKNCKPICQDDCASNGLCNVNTGMCECADEPMDLAKDLPFSDKFDPLGNKKEDKAECSITYKETPLPTPTPEPVPEPTPAPLPPSVDTGSIGGDSHDQVPHHAGDNSESTPEASEEEDFDDGDGLPVFFISFVASFIVMLGCLTCCYKSCMASRLKRRACSRYSRLPIVNKDQDVLPAKTAPIPSSAPSVPSVEYGVHNPVAPMPIMMPFPGQPSPYHFYPYPHAAGGVANSFSPMMMPFPQAMMQQGMFPLPAPLQPPAVAPAIPPPTPAYAAHMVFAPKMDK
eukprot:TRINITY_DN44_c0_g1_i7.p2 TRINITY_DN44_c0_g1~~TRINITY_DN44_c0_g1_i7.p2  ORF type:complete len:444 (-),score=130.02 TRINITY_DN44_c0_g1_i7:1416-2747(-)